MGKTGKTQSHPRLKKLRILVSVITLAFLSTIILRTDLTALEQALSRISWTATICCLALVQVQIVLSALRWRFTSRRLGQDITPFKAIREYYVASLLNQTLPGGMGGDALRAWRMRGNEPGGWKQPAKAVIFERLSGQIALMLVAMIGLSIWPSITSADLGTHARHHFILAIMVIAAMALIIVWITRQKAAESALREDLLNVFVRHNAWLLHASMSAAILFSYVATFFIAAQATGSNLPWIAGMTIIPFCLLAMLIPTGFGGWGTREAAAMALWPTLGISSVDGLAASITYGWLSLVGAAPGIIFLVLTALRKRPSVA
ncbi:lysylphosphatidylglycerol synthase transmembrane domain-containing protein [Agrobacterium tumefaciens]|uniref:lysylphosphatidylglycerol synthase transmembrane domain-containing protein n=1 Tax=Agrobacterium tumefaciens TaxID=358 RepID=UPI00287CC80C|nr:lysylphosphatidylglycerol synthase transmembrane domain-containing protein [Agrobacterium tumefaciens]MDS7594431.1 flippase-like domain-containing protein [Agrobacterium tumefaciens]